MAGSGYKAGVPKAERIEVVRRLIVNGEPDWKIRRMLVAGVKLPDGRSFKVNRATAHKYLDEIGLEYKALADSPLVVERVIGAAAERLARLADKAEAAGNYQAAIRANLALVDVVARRAPERWGRRPVEQAAGAEVEAPGVTNYDDLDDAELVEIHARKVVQFEARKRARGGAG